MGRELSATKAMGQRARALLYDLPDGMDEDMLLEHMTLAGNKRRAYKVIEDMIEIRDVYREWNGDTFFYTLSEKAHRMEELARVEEIEDESIRNILLMERSREDEKGRTT
jgi:hypothetical protein